MGRIRSVAILTKELEYATNRQTYYSTPRPGKTTVDKNPKDIYIYTCASYKVGNANAVLKIQASVSGVEKFGMADLNLKDSKDASAATAARPPRGFRPAKVRGIIGADTPTASESKVSKRRVIKYNADSSGDARSTYTAPISGESDAAQRTSFNAIVEAKAAEFKTDGYGRLYFIPEYLPTSG
ncbi:hypothetical protein [Pseudanabaena sp. 'Roaring Creek']|uniref:hypothetical protein n=1 Tax=Pseudanabaena sp. 'Roaring Creek' TaxID=1681830 RepID=UPI0006D8287E|nr:hypothetical protein [Pseudanabaena sp. 'Roaring Creek']